MHQMRAKPIVPTLPGVRAPDSRVALAIVAGVMGGACAVLVWKLPAGHVMPALGILLIICAGLTAFLAFAVGSNRRAHGFTAWDAAGLFVFVGCCAAMLSEPAHVISLLEGPLAHQAEPFPRDPPY